MFDWIDVKDDPRAERLKELMEAPATMNFAIRRVRVQKGRSFSPEAMEALTDEVVLYIGAQLMKRWEATGEPPTEMEITVSVSPR